MINKQKGNLQITQPCYYVGNFLSDKKQTKGKIESNLGGCSTIRAEHDKARKDSPILIAEDGSISQAFIYRLNVT
jgi:hypothetical protein